MVRPRLPPIHSRGADDTCVVHHRRDFVALYHLAHGLVGGGAVHQIDLDTV